MGKLQDWWRDCTLRLWWEAFEGAAAEYGSGMWGARRKSSGALWQGGRPDAAAPASHGEAGPTVMWRPPAAVRGCSVQTWKARSAGWWSLHLRAFCGPGFYEQVEKRLQPYRLLRRWAASMCATIALVRTNEAGIERHTRAEVFVEYHHFV